MAKEILEQLFDSPIKVKLLKLFLRNPEKSFELKEIVSRAKTNAPITRRQIIKLESIKFITVKWKKKKKLYSVNPNFDFYSELKSLVLKSSPASKKEILKHLKTLGKINLAVISGVFVNIDNARIDLMIVGDNVKNNKLSIFIKNLEAEVGKEIDFVVLSTKDFKYRYNMFDRFIKDVLEKPHEKLINKLKL